MNKYKVLQDKLWSYAETGMIEYKSSEAMIKFLENEGFFLFLRHYIRFCPDNSIILHHN